MITNLTEPKMTTFYQRPRVLQVLAFIALIFGVVTIFSGGQVLFGPEEKRIAAGNYVPFVLWFNFLAGFAYVVSAIGLFMRARWGAYLAIFIFVATAATFVVFGFHIFNDRAFEMRTVGAMTLRTGVWMVIAWVARKNLLSQ
ncbi:MAG: hypothetical protein OQJ97_16975 [Rhodospirillales bacterium]|nr:hypothetical protein [Rhodospirillales bacterium]